MPPFANSEISYAKATVPFPIYAAEFDPVNRGYLVVAGGGGESRSGVPNQISVLDVSNRAVITTAVELELSRDEDSVQSLASLATKDGLITFTGINSSQAQQDAGNNEHFRSFEIRYPPRKRQKTDALDEKVEGDIKEIGRRRLFQSVQGPKQEAYQRLLRLSPTRKTESGSKRIGAIATSLAKTAEIVVFNATSAVPDAADIITKIALPEKSEASDLDVTNSEDGEFSLVYCDDYSIHEQTYKYDFNSKKVQKRPDGPRRAYHMQFPDEFQAPNSRPKFRCIRFLNAENVIALVNKPNKSGAELRMYHLYPTGPAIEVHKKSLPSRIRQAASLDVCALDADKNGNQQVVVAVAGQDISIEVLTTNYSSATDTFSSLKSYISLRDVHQTQITKLCFTPFFSPPRAPDPVADTTGPNGEPISAPSVTHLHPGPQYLRLASVSFGRTVVIETFPLAPLEPPKKDSRYVLAHPGDELFWRWAYIFVFSFVVLVMAFLFQSFRTGFANTDGGVFGLLLPQSAREYLDLPAGAAYRRLATVQPVQAVPSEQPTEPSVPEPWTAPLPENGATPGFRDVIAEHHPTPEDAAATAVVVREALDAGHGFEIDVHPSKEEYLEGNAEAKHWHDLSHEQKAFWKGKLKKAGQWTEDEGESVLKGVLWSTYAGIVGDVVGEIVREL